MTAPQVLDLVLLAGLSIALNYTDDTRGIKALLFAIGIILIIEL